MNGLFTCTFVYVLTVCKDGLAAECVGYCASTSTKY